MRMWDSIFPHRLSINRSLKTASDELRTHIDEHHIKHKKAIEQCNAEIEAAKALKDKQFEGIKQEYLEQLSADSLVLGEIQTAFNQYVDEYLEKQLLLTRREKAKCQLELLNQHGNYLTEQMNLINEEIIILEKRKDALTMQAKTDDIVELVRLTGCNLPCGESENPKSLLEKTNSLLDKSNNIPQVTKNALTRLRMLLQERAEYLPVIQYISWLIQQKKNLKQELYKNRQEINAAKIPLRAQIKSYNENLLLLDELLLEYAIRVRNFWAIPMADIYVELAICEKELSSAREQHNSVQEEINHMQSIGSNDSDKWNKLWKEKNSLKETIAALNKKRGPIKKQLSQWFERKNILFNLLKQNKVFLLSPKNNKDSDEIRVLIQKRTTLCEKIEANNRKCDSDVEQCSIPHQQQKDSLIKQISIARESISNKTRSFAAATQRLKVCQKQDKRVFLKIFSDSADVANARKVQKEAESALSLANQHLRTLQDKLQQIGTASERQLSDIREKYKRENSSLKKQTEDIDLAIDFIHKKKEERRDHVNGFKIRLYVE